YLRRYGWIAVLLILIIVGGTAYNEWSKARSEASAQATGDALTAALEASDAGARAEALAPLADDNVVAAFLTAAQQVDAGQGAEAAETLAALAAQPDLDPLYRDLAQLKRLTAAPDMDGAERALILDALATPGAPYRTMAEEITALDRVRAGETEAALAGLQSILQDAEASQAQRARVSQLIVALGGTPELANAGLGDNLLETAEDN
ncbi:MAG: hypothetical protein ACU0CI_09910, partial [Shimia sp.]